MKKNTVFVSPFFDPEQISTGKWNKQVCDLLANERNLTVLSLHPFYPEWVMTEAVNVAYPYKVIRSKNILKFPSNVYLRRLMLETLFALFAFRFLYKNRKKIDEIILVIPPSIFGFLATRSIVKNGKAGSKVITVVHDLQAVHMQAGGSFMKVKLANILNWFERSIFTASDKILFLSNEMLVRSNSMVPGGILSKSVVIFPFITVNREVITDNLKNIFDEKRKSVVYSGALGDKQNPVVLLKIFNELVKMDSEVDCYIFSAGPNFELLKEEYESKKIKFHGFVDEADILEQLELSDLQVLPQARDTSGGSLPSKLPNILHASCKMFAISDFGSELASLVEDLEGVKVNYNWNVDDCVAEILDLLSEVVEGRAKRDEILELFKIEHVKKALDS